MRMAMRLIVTAAILDMRGPDIWTVNATDVRIADQRTNIFMPEQISVTCNSPTQMVFNWVTNIAQNLFSNASNPMPVALPSQASVVSYSTNPAKLNHKSQFTIQTGYNQTYAYAALDVGISSLFTNYQSPLIHHALVSNLLANTTYYYTVGDDMGNTSAVLSFKTPPAAGLHFPMRIAVAADVGNTLNSSVTFDHMLASNADLVMLVGDLTYADWYEASGEVGYQYASYQPLWDQEGRLMQPLISKIPYLTVPGNHEAEYANGVSGQVLPDDPMFSQNAFNSWWNRYGMANPTTAGVKIAPWYSSNVGPAHIVGLSAYLSTLPGSAQFKWLAADLAAVDRTVTPWVVVMMHPPLYNTVSYHYKAADCQRANLETLFYKHGVDIYVAGHVHSYERSNRVHNYTVDACGTDHFTMGDGGNIEGLRAVYVTSADGVVNGVSLDGAGFLALTPGRPSWSVHGLPVPGRRLTHLSLIQGLPGGASSARVRPSRLLRNARAPLHVSVACTKHCKPVANPFAPDGDLLPDGVCTTYQAADTLMNGMPSACPVGQPPYSAFREPSFGHATIDFLNATTALWRWHRNQDGEAKVSDVKHIHKSAGCANQGKAMASYLAGASPKLAPSKCT
ncbi:MAG: hypothetical protein WDW38_009701 [Sanguina aurantia]